MLESMGKKRRQHAEEVHQRQRATKRVKAHDGDSQRNPAVDIAKSDIKTLTDLRDLLSFRQDNSPSLRLSTECLIIADICSNP